MSRAREMSAAEYQAGIARQMSEASLQTRVEHTASRLGYRLPVYKKGELQREAPGYYHTKSSRGSQKGFPDLVLTRAGTAFRKDESKPGLIFMELKTEEGRLSPEQRAWRDALLVTARETPLVAYYVIRPTQLLDGTVDWILQGGRPPVDKYVS